jgi:tripartite-type tricarboxylate transporter receptor subunit TctC
MMGRKGGVTMRRGGIMMGRKTVFVAFLAIFMCLSGVEAAEDNYPTRTVEIIVQSAAGGGTDLGARMLAEKAKQVLGQEFTVTNKSGGGRVVLTLISKSKDDPYLLGAMTDSTVSIAPHVEKINYEPFDYTFIAQFGTLDFGVFVRPDSPFKTFRELLDWAKANPGKLTMGITEVNSGNHLALLAVCKKENIKMNFIPFMGANPTTLALLGGHVMAASSASSGFARQVKAKQVRLLCMMSDERMEAFPDVPTLVELGFSGYVFQSWYLMVGPKNMDKAVAKKLADTFRKAMESPEFKKLSNDIVTYTPKPLFLDDLKKALQKRHEFNRDLVKSVGIKVLDESPPAK